MNAFRSLLAVTLLGAASVAGAQVNLPDPSQPGGSINTAVRIIATSDIMVDHYIKRWIRTHYPGWDSEPYELQEMGSDRYAIVYITAKGNAGRRIYFKLNKSVNDDDNRGFPPL